MTQDNFIYEWKKAKEHYDVLEDGTYHIHDDAPNEVKESYREYSEMMNKVTHFATDRISFSGMFSSKNTSSASRRKARTDSEHQRLVDEVREVVKEKKPASKVKAILDNDTKKNIATAILHALPDWFGIESATSEYIEKSTQLPFWAYYNNDEPVGFLVFKKHMDHSGEIYVMGVVEKHHHQHIGSKLLEVCEAWCKENDIYYLQVKTVSSDSDDPYYEKTRKFYDASGFHGIEVFPTLWDEHNPCLLMMKHIK